MPTVRYRVAMSLDGYIAGPKGEFDWIITDSEIDFAAIFSQFDTLLVGRWTFETMATAWRTTMPGMKTIDFSRTLEPCNYPEVTIVREKQNELIASLRAGAGNDVWLFGGGVRFLSLPATRKKLDPIDHKIHKIGIVSLQYAVT